MNDEELAVMRRVLQDQRHDYISLKAMEKSLCLILGLVRQELKRLSREGRGPESN